MRFYDSLLLGHQTVPIESDSSIADSPHNIMEYPTISMVIADNQGPSVTFSIVYPLCSRKLSFLISTASSGELATALNMRYFSLSITSSSHTIDKQNTAEVRTHTSRMHVWHRCRSRSECWQVGKRMLATKLKNWLNTSISCHHISLSSGCRTLKYNTSILEFQKFQGIPAMVVKNWVLKCTRRPMYERITDTNPSREWTYAHRHTMVTLGYFTTLHTYARAYPSTFFPTSVRRYNLILYLSTISQFQNSHAFENQFDQSKPASF